MKPLLGLSALVNVALIVALAFALQVPRTSEPSPAPASPSAPTQGLVRPAPPGGATANLPKLPMPKQKGPKAPSAHALEVEDYPEFINKLRAAGLSDDTIATLVVAEIFYRGIEDTVALQWRHNTGELTQDEYDIQHRQLQKGYEAAIESFLGQDGFRRYQLEHDFQLQQLVETGAFPKETIEKYFDLRKAQEQTIRAWEDECRAQGMNPADYADKRAELEKAYQEKMSSVLGADVAAKIRAETDWQMQRLRRQMSSAPISNEKMAQIGQALQTLRLEQQRLSALTQRGDLSQQDGTKQRQAAEQQYTEQFKALLGPERVAEHEKQNDWAFRQVTLFGRPNGMNEEQMDYVYRAIKDQQTRQQELHKQLKAKQLIQADYDAALEQMNGNTRRSLERYLGVERYERLKRAVGQVP